MIELPDSYDAWKTQGPPEPEICPECGADMDEDDTCTDCDFTYCEPDYDDRDE